MSSQKKTRNSQKVSVIIPSHNQAQGLKRLLSKLMSMKKENWEVIVVDDASTDETKNIASSFPIKYYRFKKNRGPARARNKGAELAKGKILIFFDADVIPLKSGMYKALNLLNTNSKVKAISGMWAKDQDKQTFFAEFKALRDWCYYFKEPQEKGMYFFNTRVGMIRKETFEKLKGFSTIFKKADLESFEFSFRLQKITQIEFCPEFLVKHQFEGPLILVTNYFKRTYFFLDLFSTYKQFGRVVATRKEALSAVLATLVVFNVFLVSLNLAALLTLALTVSIYLLQNKAFINFILTEKGLRFTTAAILFNLFLHLVIVTSAAAYILINPVKFFNLLRP